MRGAAAAYQVHESRRKRRLELAAHLLDFQRKWRRDRTRSTTKFCPRAGRQKPLQAFVEVAVVQLLLRLSDHAIRAYITLATFANRFTGLAYPKDRLLARQLGFKPNHTNWLSGRTKINLTKRQRLVRQAQVEEAHLVLRQAISELVNVGLLEKTTRSNAYGPYRAFRYLRLNGQPRRMQWLRKSRSFFIVPPQAFVTGAFGIWARPWYGFIPIPSVALRVFLLALRDNDLLRFGGINPAKAYIDDDGVIRCPAEGWLEELGLSEEQCGSALHDLIRWDLIRPWTRVVSNIDGHLIRGHGDPSAPDETRLSILAVNGVRVG